MTGPITPHVTMVAHPDGITLTVKGASICLPAQMARDIGTTLIALSDAYDPLGLGQTALPVVTPSGQPIR